MCLTKEVGSRKDANGADADRATERKAKAAAFEEQKKSMLLIVPILMFIIFLEGI
jgi:hypothetical protein